MGTPGTAESKGSSSEVVELAVAKFNTHLNF